MKTEQVVEITFGAAIEHSAVVRNKNITKAPSAIKASHSRAKLPLATIKGEKTLGTLSSHFDANTNRIRVLEGSITSIHEG